MDFSRAEEYPNFDMLRRSKENRILKERLVGGNMNMYYDRKLPDAPAFWVLSKAEVEAIVERLHQPCTSGRRRRINESHTERQTESRLEKSGVDVWNRKAHDIIDDEGDHNQ